MATLLVRNAETVVTMDQNRREIRSGALFARDGWIEAVGPTTELPDTADEILDLKGQVLLPGLVNTHHHLYQSLTRAVPAAQDTGLFDWLRTLYPIWARLTPSDIAISTQLGLVELAMSGCTTTSDHLYLFPNGSRLDDQIEAAQPISMRLHAARGSMSLGESDGGLPPDSVVEDEGAILADTQRVIETFHDPNPGAMTRVIVAPCSPFSVTTTGMAESAALARAFGVSMHTHLAETADEDQFCLDTFGYRPLPYAESVGWVGDDVWFAHGIFMQSDEIDRIADTATGVAHCPSSNMRLASGIAPVQQYRARSVKLSLGVDGSASNDAGHMLGEARQAMLLARLAAAPGVTDQTEAMLTAREALEMATLGGASVLGRDDIGSLEPGKAADFTSFRVDDLSHAGSLHDPVAALVFCAPVGASETWVHGKPVITSGRPVGVELESLVERHNRASRRLVNG
ncbi:MAG: 8-oxoguanine deaminase [Actinomycetota bacterium]|nr:8-oxoguanine deaminase [Actinomycetota bacterium]